MSQENGRSETSITINDGFCEYQFQFNYNNKYSINDFIKTIEKNMDAKCISHKMTKSMFDKLIEMANKSQ